MTDEENPKMEEVPVEEQPEEQANTTATDDKALDGNTTIAINGVGVTMDGTQLPLVIVLISSIILLIATTSDATAQTTAYENYVISVSCISLILSLICLVVHKFGGDLYNKIGKYLCMTNFLWIFIGACFLTFRGPFQTVSLLPFVCISNVDDFEFSCHALTRFWLLYFIYFSSYQITNRPAMGSSPLGQPSTGVPCLWAWIPAHSNPTSGA